MLWLLPSPADDEGKVKWEFVSDNPITDEALLLQSLTMLIAQERPMPQKNTEEVLEQQGEQLVVTLHVTDGEGKVVSSTAQPVAAVSAEPKEDPDTKKVEHGKGPTTKKRKHNGLVGPRGTHSRVDKEHAMSARPKSHKSLGSVPSPMVHT